MIISPQYTQALFYRIFLCGVLEPSDFSLDIFVYTVYICYIQYNNGVRMNLFISATSGTPLYEQLSAQIREHIIAGRLKKHDALPSIRALASDLHISVITVKRTYEELSRAGFLYAVPAKGYFIAEVSEAEIVRTVYDAVRRHMQAACIEAVKVSIPAEELHRLLDEVRQEAETSSAAGEGRAHG